MYWNEHDETMAREARQQLQLQRLQSLVGRVYERVPFYRRAFDACGLKPGDVASLADLARLPFTVKQDFRDQYPLGLAAAPQEQIVRLHASSGTTGKPTVVAYSAADIELWSEVMARALAMAGLGRDDVIQIAYGYGLFTGGLGAHYGGERLGATVIPASSGNSRRQVMLIEDLGVTALCCTPSYALYLAETAEDLGVDLSRGTLKVGVFGAEPWSFGMRAEIERKLGVQALDIYGLSEIIGPGVAMECPEKCGLHIAEDHFLAEIVDPATGEVLPEGEKGELVLTTLTKEAMPVLRYRTHDITSLESGVCGCGRTLVRMAKVTGRSDDMLIVRGVNVFPSQIESVLLQVPGVVPHYQIVVDREQTLDELEIWVEIDERTATDEIRRLEAVEWRVRAEIESVLGIMARVKLVEPRSIQRSEGKAKRVIDRREL